MSSLFGRYEKQSLALNTRFFYTHAMCQKFTCCNYYGVENVVSVFQLTNFLVAEPYG